MKCNKLMSCGRRSFVRNTLALMVVGVPVLWSCSRDENAPEDAAGVTDEDSRAGAQSPDSRVAEQDMSEEMTGGNETKAAKADVNYQDSPKGAGNAVTAVTSWMRKPRVKAQGVMWSRV